MIDFQPSFDFPDEPDDPFEPPADRNARRASSARIAASPEGFFFCEACGNLYKRGGPTELTGVCMVCHGYRLNFDPKEVAVQAIRNGSGPKRSVLPSDYR